MDSRKWLANGSVLPFPGMSCTIRAPIGRGSNALVYRGTYADETSAGHSHDVLIKELFPLDPRGTIYRAPDDSICVEKEGESLYRLHRESFERGNQIHLSLLKTNPAMVGGNVNTFAWNNTLYTLMGCSGSIEFQSAMHAEHLTLHKIVQRTLCLLDALEVFHTAGLLHLDVSPDNVLLIPQGTREHVLLIDYNSVGTYEEWQNKATEYRCIKSGYTPPEICNGEMKLIGPHSDLYSVTAVFYTCLVDRPLTLEETVASVPPDASQSRYLLHSPDTVLSMVKRILRRGLNTLPSRRYRCIDDLRADLLELLDRIDCVGVTHWAIYENSRKLLNAFIRSNPSYAFLQQQGRLYPMHFSTDEACNDVDCNDVASGETASQTLSEEEFLEAAVAGAPILLGANGGLGKTTALLHMALTQNATYRANEPVAVFLSAYAYRPREKWFIHDSLLRALKFKPDTDTYAAARHELDLLLSYSLKTPSGHKPVLLILLDGLNEVTCDASLLIQELNDLSALSGVALVISSRSEIQGLSGRHFTLEPLSEQEVQSELSANRLLMPEDSRMHQLLRMPLMLSMFIRAATTSGSQLNASTAEELMQLVMQMEINRFPEERDEHWQMAVAIQYVLPAIAAQELRHNGALTESELLKTVAQCYQTVSHHNLSVLSSAWIGHRRAILANAQTLDDWYSVMVLELLWQHSGLLIRDENGRFRLFHQQFRDWLLTFHQLHRHRLRQRRLLRSGIALVISLCLLLGLWRGVWIPVVQPLLLQEQQVYYPEDEMDTLLRSAITQCKQQEEISLSVRTCLNKASEGDRDYFNTLYDVLVANVQRYTQNRSESYTLLCEQMEQSYPEDALMPWSKKGFAFTTFSALATLPYETCTQYLESLRVLEWLVLNDEWYELYAESYIDTFMSVLDMDRAIAQGYYNQLILPELTAMETTDNARYVTLRALYPCEPRNGSDLATLLALRKVRLTNLQHHAAVDRYSRLHEQETEETDNLYVAESETVQDVTFESAFQTLQSDWENRLSVTNEIYQQIFWALDYVDAWTQDQTWENLAKAKTACLLLTDYLDAVTYPEMALTSEEKLFLGRNGVSIVYLENYSDLNFICETVRMYVRYYLFPNLEQSFYVADLLNSANIAASVRKELEYNQDFLYLNTNLLFLPFYTEQEGVAFWQTLQEKYPLLFPSDSVWSTDDEALANRVSSLVVPFSNNDQSHMEALLQNAARSKNELMDIADNREREKLTITGCPKLIPMPEWYSSNYALYRFIRYVEGNRSTPQCGDVLTTGDCSMEIFLKGVTAQQFEDYIELLTPYTDRMSLKQEHYWLATIGNYGLGLTWSDGIVDILFVNQTSTFSAL